MTVSINGTSGLVFNDASTQATAATGFGFKNRIINGAMMIDQRNAGSAVTVNDTYVYTLDRWEPQEYSDGVISVQQSTEAPAGFKNSLKVTATTADASLGAGQYSMVQHKIEGLNIVDLAWGTASASPVTLSFWVRSSLTGTFGGAVSNSAENRCYAFTYTISSANTWEQKSITISGDTTGTWLTTNGVGIRLMFGLGVGSTYSVTAGSWGTTQAFSASGATSVIGTLSATWQITGVQLEKGSTATSFDYRPYGAELALCQRYYWQRNSETTFAAIAAGHMNAATVARVAVNYPVPMRAIPTVSCTSVGSLIINQGGTDITPSGLTSYSNSTSALVDFATSGGTIGRGATLIFNNTSFGSIQASAEL
jgi:hypothetical protein